MPQDKSVSKAIKPSSKYGGGSANNTQTASNTTSCSGTSSCHHHHHHHYPPKHRRTGSSGKILIFFCQNIWIFFFQILWKSKCHILVTFPSHLKKLRSNILIFWLERMNCGFFHYLFLTNEKTPQNNFSCQCRK